MLGVNMVAGQVVAKPLSAQAQRALEDFAYFRRRYFGRESTPWQVRAANEVVRAIQSPEREYICMNEPPGTGKSTLFTCDIPTWLIVRDRTIRIMIGSRTERQARMYVNRIKRALEREVPMQADAESLLAGVAFDAEATIIADFGVFKPEGRSEKWRTDGFVVQQTDGVSLDDKEDTVSAWGQDSGFLGGRFDFVVWDDLVDRKNMKTQESRDSIREWWDTEAESRLEPRGTMLLQGQRIQSNDLYRHVLDKRNIDETPRYRHVVYKAHYEDMCTDDHGPTAKAWPDGCLLDPYRLPKDHLDSIAHNNPRSYTVLYQQEDGGSADSLIDPVWIDGGVDRDGFAAPGCLDKERGLFDVPEHLLDRGWSFVTVDPSPTEWWAVIWWLYDPDTGNRYIIDLVRRRMNPEHFLTVDMDRVDEPGMDQWSGLIEEMRLHSLRLSIPIEHVIVEINAAQRWLLSQPHVQKWMKLTGVVFLPHTTGGANKNDPKYGLESIGDLFRQGRIRIPWKDVAARGRMKVLIDEGTNYPEYDTTDTLMSTWFGKLAVENTYRPRFSLPPRFDRLGVSTGTQRGMRGR